MGKGTILLVNACNERFDSLGKLLHAEDYVVISANNGIDAVEQSMSTTPDLVVLDDEMSIMRWYQVCHLLKNDPVTDSIPVILLTDNEQSCRQRFSFFASPDEYIHKDCDLQKLLKTVQGRLDKNVSNKSSATGTKTEKSIDRIDIIKRLNFLLDKKVYEAALFSDLTGLVQNIFSYDDIALAVMDIFPKLVDYSIAMVLILSEDEPKLIIHLHKDINTESFSDIKELALGAFKEEMIGFDESKVWLKIIREDRIKSGEKINDIRSDTLLFSQFENSGILKKGFILFGSQECELDKTQCELLNIVINEACIILENSWLYGKLYKNIKNLTITDGLTNIYNHKYIVGLVSQEFSRAKRYNHKISIIMFDIDCFKEINDTFGHQTGDVVLRQTATVLKEAIRKSDIVGRYGGEEFTVILPETDTKEALLLAERLRERIESYDFFNPGDPLKITASLGLATYPSDAINDPKTFIECADQALYRAKSGGRNRVCVCGEKG